MDHALISAIRSRSKEAEGQLEFQPEEGTKQRPFDKENFSPISQKPGRILFVDGGSHPLFEAAGFTVAMIRVSAAIFEGKKRTFREQKDATLIIGAGDQFEVFPNGLYDDLKAKDIDSFRRLVELKTALTLTARLNKGDVICLDGSLCPKADRSLLNQLASACEGKGLHLVGLSKTTDLATKAGKPLGQALASKTNLASWSYAFCQDYPLGGEVYGTGFVRFHPKSRYTFRFDAKSPDALPFLASHCHDPSFLGYPYGLLDADRFARIGHVEAEAAKLQIRLKVPELRPIANDAHDHLDAVNATKKFK